MSTLPLWRKQTPKCICSWTMSYGKLLSPLPVCTSKEIFSALAMPWRRDPHADRKVVHEIGCRALELITSGATKIEYPIWLWENGSIEDWPEKEEVNPFRLDISSVTDRKSGSYTRALVPAREAHRI